MKIFEVAHAIGQEVRISALGVNGLVVAVLLEQLGNRFRVAYWHDSKRYEEWLFESELEEKHD